MKLTNYLPAITAPVKFISGAFAALALIAAGTSAFPHEAAAAEQGSVTVCMIVMDEDGEFASERDDLPNATFELNLLAVDDGDASEIESVRFETMSFNPNQDIVGESGNEAECVDLKLAFGEYAFDEVDVEGEWMEPKYDVTSGTPADDIDDFEDYDDKPFMLDDENPSWTISFVASLEEDRSNGNNENGSGSGTSDVKEDAAAEVMPGMVLVTWKTDEAGSSMVVYGTEGVSATEVRGSTWSKHFGYMNATVEVFGGATEHRVAVLGLSEGSTYYMRAVSRIGDRWEVGKQLAVKVGGQTATVTGPSAGYISSHMRLGSENDPVEVAKLQTFLRNFEGHDVSTTGQFDDKTFSAVVKFQEKYRSEILAPWGYSRGTGNVYILTKNKINELMGGTEIALTQAEAEELASFRRPAAGTAPAAQPGAITIAPVPGSAPVVGSAATTGGDEKVTSGTTTGELAGTTTEGGSNGVMGNLAAAVFSLPDTGTEMTRCIFNLVIILAIIYIVTSILVGGDDAALPRARARFRKLMFFIGGLIIALAFALFFDLFCLILPLCAALVIAALMLAWDRYGGRTPTTGPKGGGAVPPSTTPLIVESPKTTAGGTAAGVK